MVESISWCMYVVWRQHHVAVSVTVCITMLEECRICPVYWGCITVIYPCRPSALKGHTEASTNYWLDTELPALSGRYHVWGGLVVGVVPGNLSFVCGRVSDSYTGTAGVQTSVLLMYHSRDGVCMSRRSSCLYALAECSQITYKSHTICFVHTKE